MPAQAGAIAARSRTPCVRGSPRRRCCAHAPWSWR